MHTRTFLFLPWLLLLDIYNLMCHGNFTDHATIVVKIDPDQVHSPLEAGTVLKGTVYLDVRASSIDYSALQLLFTGSEDTCIHYTTTSGSGSDSTHYCTLSFDPSFIIHYIYLKQEEQENASPLREGS